jgi:hypothetical protein
LRGRSAAAAALSTINNPTVLNTAMNPAVLSTANNPVVTSDMIFITLIPLFVEALGRATEGRPYLPPGGRAVFHRCIFDPFAEHDFARHKILNKGLTSLGIAPAAVELGKEALPTLSR